MSITGNISSTFFLFSFILSVLFGTDAQSSEKLNSYNRGITKSIWNDNLDTAPEWMQLSDMVTMNFAADDSLLDGKMADKYGLNIPLPLNKLEPAPEWLQKADMFTHNQNELFRGYKATPKDTLVPERAGNFGNSRRMVTKQYSVATFDSFDGSSIKGVSLISHVPKSKKTYEEVHNQGFKVIPYIHLMDININFLDQDVFLFQHPEIFLKDVEGKWGNTLMDGTYRMYRFLTCANSPSYWKLSLAYVKKLMDEGADGIFIDNVDHREPCFATKFNGRNPEFPPYEHEHLFPNASQDYAFDRLLQTIHALVKSYGQDKIVLLNSGIGTLFQKNGDCCMWESFIYSWAWEGRRDTWADVKKRAQDNAWYLSTGRRITALSTINRSSKEAKDDAFWAFSAAKLVDFIWWASLKGTGAEALYQAHMGKGLEPLKEINGVAYRAFENGIIVLNDSPEDQNVELTLPTGFLPKRLLDLHNGSQIIQVKNKKVKVAVSKKTARVYLLSQSL